MPTAFSYLRFSSPEQAKGDSIRRQMEATSAWCQRNDVSLDQSLTLRDEGVSAFRGKNRENPDVHGMAAFLQAVKTGRVPEGSFLILENLDRLTRESIVPATHLFTGLLMAGVKVVQLRPSEQVFTAGADMTAVMLALVELSRGNSESAMKSERVGAAWTKKRNNAAQKIVTRRVPVWIDYDEDSAKLVLNRDKAKVMRRLFRMVTDGLGLTAIAKTLNEERVPVLGRTTYHGRAVVWSAGTVYKLVTSRACIGEYQPHKGRPGDRKPSGPPVADYYPAVITPDLFATAQASLRRRFIVGRGRPGKHVNLFAGLLRDARTGGSLMVRFHKTRGAVIFPSGATHGRGDQWVSYLLAPFEEAIRARLDEVKVEDITTDSGAVSKVEALAGRLSEVEALAVKWKAKMDDPRIVDTVAEKLADLEARRRAIASELAEVQREASSPISEAWGQTRAAGKALAKDNSDEARLRYRSALRRSVDSIWVLARPGRGVRAAFVQVWFKSGIQRSYLIGYRPGMANKKMKRPYQLLAPLSTTAGSIDLQKRADVAKVEKILSRLDLVAKIG